MIAYTQPTGPIKPALDRLRRHLVQVPERLHDYSEADLTFHLPGKWSRKQLLGHLIDSALNNLKRFTDAPLADGPYQLQGYQQDELVLANRYQDLPLGHLLSLWSSLNTQIIYVAEAIPAELLSKPIRVENPTVDTLTLGWLIKDYVAHLEHHLKTML